MEEKTCKKCGRTLPAEKFKLTRWGTRCSVCTDCATKLASETKAKQRVKIETMKRELRLADFTPRELMEELCRRGYEGKLTYTHVETIDITNF